MMDLREALAENEAILTLAFHENKTKVRLEIQNTRC